MTISEQAISGAQLNKVAQRHQCQEHTEEDPRLKKNRLKLDVTSVTNNTRLKIQVSGNLRDVAEAMENMIVLLRMQTAENATKKAILL